MNIYNPTTPVKDAIWSFDLVGNKFLYINKGLVELYGLSKIDVKRNPFFWLSYVHPDDYNVVKGEYERLLEKDEAQIEYRIVVGDKTKWVIDKKVIVKDDQQSLKVLTCTLSDITESRDSFSDDNSYSYLFLENPIPLWIYDRETLRFLEVNNAAIAKYGYSREEFLSLTIADIRPDEDRDELLEFVRKVKNRYSNTGRYWRHLKKNGELIYVNISGHGINYKGRKAEIVIAHDITIEVKSRQKVTLAKENLDALINSIDEEMWSIDTDYKLISANNSYIKLIKKSLGREIKLGDPVFLEEFETKDVLRWKKYYQRAMQGETFSFIELIQAVGSPFFAEVKMGPIKDRKRIIGVACISNNIEDRIKAQKAIVDQNNKLHELISLVSHEIRGPVASLLGLTRTFNLDNHSDPFNKQVIMMVQDVSRKLDSVLHQLVDKSHSLKQKNKSTSDSR